jgi:hypothetical protein
MTPFPSNGLGPQALGIGLAIFGALMLWLWGNPRRNALVRAVYGFYARTSPEIPTRALLLVGGVVLVTAGAWLALVGVR